MNKEVEIQAIRQALIAGERCGPSSQTVDDIWEEAQRRHKAQNG